MILRLLFLYVLQLSCLVLIFKLQIMGAANNNFLFLKGRVSHPDTILLGQKEVFRVVVSFSLMRVQTLNWLILFLSKMYSLNSIIPIQESCSITVAILWDMANIYLMGHCPMCGCYLQLWIKSNLHTVQL